MVHTMAGHYPAGSSAKTMFQFFDNYNSGTAEVNNTFKLIDPTLYKPQIVIF